MKHLLAFLFATMLIIGLTRCKSPAPTTTPTTVSNDESSMMESSIRRIWVAPFRKKCPSASKQKCLLVSFSEKRPVQGEWEVFESPIENFTYEAGYLYRLNIEIIQSQEMAVEGNGKTYRLLEILSQEGA